MSSMYSTQPTAQPVFMGMDMTTGALAFSYAVPNAGVSIAYYAGPALAQ